MFQPEVHREIHEFFSGGVRCLLLPDSAGFEGLDPHALEAALSPQNRQILKSITNPARRSEFLRTRFLVRLGAGLTSDPQRDSEGLIQWPVELCGSVSHSLGNVLVATSQRTSYVSIGVDMERPSRISDKLAEKICTDFERNLIATGAVSLAEVFSAKEALFKCHYSLGRRRFWFLDAEISAVKVHLGTKKLDLRVLIDTSAITPANTLTRVDILAMPIGEFILALAQIPTTSKSMDHVDG